MFQQWLPRVARSLDELAKQVNGTAQSETSNLHAEYLRHLNSFEASIKRCTVFLRQHGGSGQDS